MRVIIAGSRDEVRYQRFLKALSAAMQAWGIEENAISEVVSGAARGVDRIGEVYAENCGIPIKRFPARWDVYGKRAGSKRNQQMADYCEPEVDGLIAIPGPQSVGTWDMVRRAKARGLRVYVDEAEGVALDG